MPYRVLVVDDYEPWRRRIAAELHKSDRWRVVGECVDGADAVREAEALRPDLIILDVGLKTVNGIEAARRIVAGDPSARILFLTGQQSPDIAEAAMAIGGRGYLFKSEAGPALRRALEAVVAGARFVSPGLPALDAIVPTAHGPCHSAAFHSTEAALIDDYARFAEAALGRAQPVLVLAPRARLDKIHERLEARGVHINDAIDERRYEVCDIEPELARLMPGGRYDRERLRESAASMLDTLAKRAGAGGPVAACGEIAPRLWKDGRADIALDIERVWDETARAAGADVFCGYCADTAQLAEQEYSVFRDICAVHGAVHVR